MEIGVMFVAWKGAGDDGRLFFNSINNNQNLFTDQSVIPGAGGSSHGPALAAGSIANPANPAITLRAVADEGRFIEVTGIRFTPNQTVKLGYDIFGSGAPTPHQTSEDTLTSNREGSFIHRIRVNLGGDVKGATVEATDLASDMTATAEISM